MAEMINDFVHELKYERLDGVSIINPARILCMTDTVGAVCSALEVACSELNRLDIKIVDEYMADVMDNLLECYDSVSEYCQCLESHWIILEYVMYYYDIESLDDVENVFMIIDEFSPYDTKDRIWTYIDCICEEEGDYSEENLERIAQELGVL